MCYWFFPHAQVGRRSWFHVPWRAGRRNARAGTGVAEEAASFLQGTYAEPQRAAGETVRVPPWVWLNGIAHGSLSRVGS